MHSLRSLRRAFLAQYLALFAALLVASDRVNSAGTWDARWVNPGIDREVLTLAVRPDGSLIVGGRFGGTVGSPRRVASWREGLWSKLGAEGSDGVPDDVHASVTVGTNTYLAGEFGASSSGIILNGVARWDGQALHSLGSGPLAGVQGQVYALAAAGDTLYVAGRFRQAGTVGATNIVRWDGTNWTPLGGGLGTGENDRVSALLVTPEGTLYAGGSFQNAGGQTVRRLARWDGTQWTEVGGGVDGAVQALAWFNGQLVAGGSFAQAGTVPAANLARWDGIQWSGLGTGVSGEVSALAVQGARLLVGGAMTTAGGSAAGGIAAWTGSDWETLGPGFAAGNPTAVRTLVVRDDGVFAGGNFLMAGGAAVFHVARWDGSSWQALDASLTGGEIPRVTAVAARNGEAVIGGSFTSAGGRPMARVARWDGTQWQAMGSGFDNPPLALAHGPDGQVYAGGDFTRGGQKIARWNGSSWVGLGSGVNGSGTVFTVLVTPAGEVYAGGIFTRVGGTNAFGIARWNGIRWSPLGDGLTQSGIAGTARALAWADGWLYVGGTFDRAGGVPVNNLARWNGSVWEDVGGGVSSAGLQSTVYALTTFEGGVLVGGDFARAGETAFARLARWQPGTGAWSQPGGSPDGTVRAFALLDDRLQAGGEFSHIGGVAARGLAQWDQDSWQEVGGGVRGHAAHVTGLAAASTNLWVIGPFTGVGDLRAADLARWGIPFNEPPVVAFDSPAAGTEFAHGSTITLRLNASDPEGTATRVRLTANGMPLAELTTSPFEFAWNDVFPDIYQLEAVAVDAQDKTSAPAQLTVVMQPPAGNQPPQVALTEPAAGPLTVGQPFTLAATASDPDGHILRVAFFRNDQPLGAVDAVPFRLPAAALPAGEFTLRAVATDNVGGKATSAPVTVQFVLPGAAPEPKWVFDAGASFNSSVALAADGTIYLTPGPGENKLVALNPDGTVRWAYQDAEDPLAWPTIADNGDIIATRSNGRLVAVSPAGAKRWEFEGGGRTLGAPAISREGVIYFGSENQRLYAINGEGVRLWDLATGDSLSSAAPAIAADGAILLGSNYGNLICVNPDGTERWRFPVPGSASTAPALADDGTIYFVSSLGSLFALTPAGTRLWEYKSGSTSLDGSPVIGPDGTVYFGVADGNLHAVSPGGQRQWAFKTGDALSGTPAVAADGSIYFAAHDRNIYAVYPTGYKRWSLLTEGRSGASAAIGADGTIYAAASDNRLYAIPGTAPLAASQWPKFHRDARQTGRGSLLPQITLHSPTNDAAFLKPAPVLFSAGVSSPNGAIARVEFRLGDDVVGTDTEAPFEFAWTNPPTGVLELSARVVDAAGASAVSPTVRILVSAAGAAPQIVTAPQAATVAPGDTVTLGVEALGQPPLSFQWFKDDQALPAQNGSTLHLPNVSAADSAEYSVQVSNAGGQTMSDPALVTVLYPPEVFWTQNEASGGRPPALGPSGFIYTTSQTGALHCRNRAGALVWALDGGASTELVVADDGSLCFGRGGQLVRVSDKGREIWSQPTDGLVEGLARTAGDTIYLTTSSGALEAWSLGGTNRWRFPTLLTGATSPSITADGSIVFAAGDGRIYSVLPDGSKRWEYNTLSPRLTKASIGPDGVIILGVDSRVLALNPDGTRRWEFTGVGAAAQPIIGPDGAVYVGAADPRITTQPVKGRAVVLNADGTVRWELELPEPVIAAGSLAADGTWFVCSGPELFSLNPNGTIRSRYLGGSFLFGSTIGFDGTVYLGSTFGGLHAISGTTAMPTNGWPCAARDVRQRSDASSQPDPDEWFFPLASSAFDGPVTAIVPVPGGVYVGGEFTVAGGRPANRIAFWNGTNWLALGEGVTGPVREMVFFDGQLYVWSMNTSEPGTPPPLLLRWDGLNWSRDDAGLDAWPMALTAHDGALHAISQLMDSDQIHRRYLVRHDGTRWNPVGTPVAGNIHKMLSRADGLYAANNSVVQRFDGTNWHNVGGSFNDTVYTLHETPLGLFAGGNFRDPASNSGFVARWNGNTWETVGGGLRQREGYFGSVFTMATQGNDLLAGGFFSAIGQTNVPGVARWNGTNWVSLAGLEYYPADLIGGPGALAVKGSEIYLGGSFLRLNGDSELRYFGVFRDNSWASLGPKLVLLDGQLQLTLFNFLGRPFAVEISPDLRAWTQEFLYSDLDKPAHISIPVAPGSSGQFLRIVVP